MASRPQQIGIWIIAVTLTLGTIGSFVAIILANDNQRIQQASEQEEFNRQLEEFERQQREAQEANAANSEPLDGYSATPFNGDEVTELVVEVLERGDGAVLTAEDTISASYFGWLSDGTIFDSSNKRDADNAPVSFPLTGVIEGWTEGLTGQTVGSTVKLTIPAEQAYGPNGSGVIPANAPLQFIVIIEERVDA